MTALSSAGCATTVPYLYNDTALNVTASESPHHVFTYVRSYEDDGELVLYGKVDHNHGECPDGVHVDLAISAPAGEMIALESLPLKRSTSPKQHGWYGASFRTKLAPIPPAGSRVALVVHDRSCIPADEVFDCGENAAEAASRSATPGPAAEVPPQETRGRGPR